MNTLKPMGNPRHHKGRVKRRVPVVVPAFLNERTRHAVTRACTQPNAGTVPCCSWCTACCSVGVPLLAVAWCARYSQAYAWCPARSVSRHRSWVVSASLAARCYCPSVCVRVCVCVCVRVDLHARKSVFRNSVITGFRGSTKGTNHQVRLKQVLTGSEHTD